MQRMLATSSKPAGLRRVALSLGSDRGRPGRRRDYRMDQTAAGASGWSWGSQDMITEGRLLFGCCSGCVVGGLGCHFRCAIALGRVGRGAGAPRMHLAGLAGAPGRPGRGAPKSSAPGGRECAGRGEQKGRAPRGGAWGAGQRPGPRAPLPTLSLYS